jgi:hypothetical protein
MGLLLVTLLVFFLISLIPAACVHSWGARIAILILVPLVGTAVLYIVVVELHLHGYLGGT